MLTDGFFLGVNDQSGSCIIAQQFAANIHLKQQGLTLDDPPCMLDPLPLLLVAPWPGGGEWRHLAADPLLSGLRQTETDIQANK